MQRRINDSLSLRFDLVVSCAKKNRQKEAEDRKKAKKIADLH